jgi:hypothetical protein
MAEIINLCDERKHQEELKGAILDVRMAFALDGTAFGLVCKRYVSNPTATNWDALTEALIATNLARVLTDDKLK